ncbi:glycoside hydrolase family 28 protein [Neorhizobium sp. JUb45]|uniref:polygalacturonase PglA n=1 Tax=unclassified Neorhizobium TaxID=2629175 RepID=UPI00104D190B|nr:glycoside hydrolase family 28 protein [Neorhizobium sp. JUb45]TCR03303.1 polygalacturonase [Neorhizobium sp. JUb45]
MNKAIAVAISGRIAAIRLPVPGARYELTQPLSWRLSQAGSNEFSQQGTTDRVVTLVDGLEPDTRYRLSVEGFADFHFQTRGCAGLVNAANFGLVADAPLTDLESAQHNASKLNEALAYVPVGGTLHIGPGVWTTLPLALKSDMTLNLAKGAVLRAPSLRDGWPILPAHDAADHMLGSWEGLPDACFAAPVHAIGTERLIIEGRGVLDGSGNAGDWWTWPKETRNGARRPRGLHLIDCRDVTLLGFTIRNAPSWTVHPQGCDGLKAVGLHIQAPHDSPNTDGFDPEGCTDVRVEGVRFSVGDDCIAIKAGKRGRSGEAGHLRETRGIDIRHCMMERGHGGVVIGSEMSGGVHDVTVEDCEMIGTDRGLRIKTRRGRGGAISNIAMRRVRMDGVLVPLSANAHYFCDADGHDEWVQSREPAAVVEGTPEIDGILVEDVDVHGLALATGVFLGLPEMPIRNIRIRQLRVHSHDPTATPMPPIMADGVRPMRHEGILGEHAEIDCDNLKLLSTDPISLSNLLAAS